MTEVYEQLDLCEVITDVMRTIGFSEDSIEATEQDEWYVKSTGSHPSIQRTNLTMMFFNRFMKSKTGERVPSRIRMAINYSSDNLGWIEDIKLVVLPFLKENEATFF